MQPDVDPKNYVSRGFKDGKNKILIKTEQYFQAVLFTTMNGSIVKLH